MHETLVLCGGLQCPQGDKRARLELDVSPNADPARRIGFETDAVAAPLLDDLPDVVADALELAVYLYCADRLVRRGGSNAPRGMGSDWQRDFQFRIPVRQLEVWQKPRVHDALVEVLSFLSGDRFEFLFEQARSPLPLEPYLGFSDRNAQVIHPERVVLFSGGLDSLAGVARDVVGGNGSAILVTHHSASITINLQNALAKAIGERTSRGQTFYAPVRVRRGVEKPLEHSQRLRSFLFATLGMTYARMFGVKSVQFYENGVTSFNLPIAEHVLGTRASRTTHPRVLAGYDKFFSALLEDEVRFTNPFLWQTKSDIVKTIAEFGCADLIALTTSCASVRNLSMTGVQCGICSQCVERRVAMAAAGLENIERPYQCDMFLGPVDDPQGLTMVEGHLLRARRFAGMTQQGFVANHGQAFRALAAIGDDAQQAIGRMFELHHRYGAEFEQVVNQQLARQASVEGMRAIRHPSLLAMLLPEHGQRVPLRDPAETEPPASQQAFRAEASVGTIVLAVDEKQKRIRFSDGPVIKGRSYELIEALVEHARQTRHHGDPKEAPYIHSGALCTKMQVLDQNLRRIVNRARGDLSAAFERKTGYLLDPHDVVESDPWRGYRLNPFVAIVALEEMPATRPVSHNAGESVTQQPSIH